MGSGVFTHDYSLNLLLALYCVVTVRSLFRGSSARICLFLCILDTVSLCASDWPVTLYADQAAAV